jgi:hypothetical protein
VQPPPRMRAAIAIACLLAVPGAAAAEGYAGYGMSPAFSLEGGITDHFASHDDVGGRFHGGLREGNVAIELSVFGVDLTPLESRDPLNDTDWSSYAVGIGARYFIELEPTVQLYGRAGVDRTWLAPSVGYDEEDGPDVTLRGVGLDYGTGIELGSRRVPGRWGARIWFDIGRHHVNLESRTAQMSATFNTFTMGFNVQR